MRVAHHGGDRPRVEQPEAGREIGRRAAAAARARAADRAVAEAAHAPARPGYRVGFFGGPRVVLAERRPPRKMAVAVALGHRAGRHRHERAVELARARRGPWEAVRDEDVRRGSRALVEDDGIGVRAAEIRRREEDRCARLVLNPGPFGAVRRDGGIGGQRPAHRREPEELARAALEAERRRLVRRRRSAMARAREDYRGEHERADGLRFHAVHVRCVAAAPVRGAVLDPLPPKPAMRLKGAGLGEPNGDLRSP